MCEMGKKNIEIPQQYLDLRFLNKKCLEFAICLLDKKIFTLSINFLTEVKFLHQ